MRNAVVAVLCVALGWLPAGCTAPKAVHRPDAATTVDKLRIGEEVRITARNGKDYVIEVGEIGDSYLRGRDRSTGKIYRIPYADIVVLEYPGLDARETAAGIGVTVFVLYVLATVVAIIALARASDDFGCSLDFFGSNDDC